MLSYGIRDYGLKFKLCTIFRVGQFAVISVGLGLPVVAADKVDHVSPPAAGFTRVGFLALVQKHRPIERVALDGFEAGVSYDSAQLFFGGAVTGSCRLHYIFF